MDSVHFSLRKPSPFIVIRLTACAENGLSNCLLGNSSKYILINLLNMAFSFRMLTRPQDNKPDDRSLSYNGWAKR